MAMIDRAKCVAEMADRMRAAGVPNAEEVAERIGDRYVELLEEKLRGIMRGTDPHRPRGILRFSSPPTVENDWARRRFLEGRTDEMLADAGLYL